MRKFLLVLFLFLLFFIGCERQIAVDQKTFEQMVSHRSLGLAYLEEERYSAAVEEFRNLITIAPKEPLGYANLGLTYLRMSEEFENAEKWLQKAIVIEPDHPEIRFLLAKVYELTDREPLAINILEETLSKHPNHILTLYQLVQFYTHKQTPILVAKAEKYLIKIVDSLPANLVAQLKLIELLIKNSKPGNAIYYMETIRQVLPQLPKESLDIFQNSLELLYNGNAEQSYVPVLMFHNLMKPTSYYKAGITELRGTDSPIASAPIYRFIRTVLPASDEPSQIPNILTFTTVTEASGLSIIPPGDSSDHNDNNVSIIFTLGDYDADGDQDLFVSTWSANTNTSCQYLFTNDHGVFSDIATASGITHSARDLFALFADYDNDGYLDLFLTNTNGNKLYKNSGEGSFHPVSTAMDMRIDFNGAAAVFADLDLEGDLDLFIATDSENQLYRNNSDGTFTEIGQEAGVSGTSVPSRDIVFGDFDDDGDIDLFVLNQDGSNRYYDNLRQGYFRDITQNTGLATNNTPGSLATGDYNNDGSLDLFVTDLAGKNHILFRNRGDGTFEPDAKFNIALQSIDQIHAKDATFFDADNDGFLDLLITGIDKNKPQPGSGVRFLYNNGSGEFLNASSLLPENLGSISQVDVADYDNDGDLDIFMSNSRGEIHLLRNDGGNINNFLNIRLAGLRTGSSKNNYFGIGAKVEVKAGDLYQMRYMDQPTAHFGLGNRDGADVVRVLWSNGVPQNRFKPERNQTIVETQILKGSCPYLYAWNGSEYTFVTDVLWPSALGMPLGIMAGEPLYAFPNSTDEYLMMHGEKVLARDGKYTLQFTTELWESPYLDNINLIVLDHPESVDVYINETFIPPPYPPFRIYSVANKHLPLSAMDQLGNDLRNTVLDQDQEYTMHLTPATYQGITELHDLILDFGDLDHADSIFLFLQGWLFPTDASINVNISQASVTSLIFPQLQVVNQDGNWETVIENLGFPKGKNKIMIVDLTERFIAADYRVRIRTNMQIYWDHIFIATDVTNNDLAVVSLQPISADLHYRGFSTVSRKDFNSPHLPDYYNITTGQKWRDLTGTYTRYGDVLPLLLESDSKYVIMNAGDEISLEFIAADLPDLPENWRRDFLFYNDGWLKDGDLNTAHGQTVEPLPFHGMTAYPYGPDDAYPENKDFKDYMSTYNTRQIKTETFKQFLRQTSK